MLELLSTKLFIPRPRANQVSRPRLTSRLNAGLERKVSLIAAPAGFGKTTLLSEWIPRCPHCVTWLFLDEGDNDPTRFWTYFVASVQQIHPDLGEGALALLQSSQAPAIEAILTSLINDIAAYPDRFATVLDDYHIIDFQPIHEGLAYLIEHLPANYHLVITTRKDPPLPLARLRGRGQLTELRASDLRFSAEETAAFLGQALGLSLSAEEVAAVESRTEGWITGLQIAALSLQGQDDFQEFIEAFSGSHRHILGYLAEEVLNQRPKGTMDFLVQTSILDRLCGPLCDAVTRVSGGQAMLEKVEHANLFITPLDEGGVWYRYHHLFAEVLQARLQRTCPDRIPELHRRAGDWYESEGMIEEAVHHALAGADFSKAARRVENVAGNILRQGSSATLTRWLGAIPEETVRSHPRLCLARGWIDFMGAVIDLEGAEEWAQLALRVARAGGALDPALAGEAAALQAMVAATRSEVERSLDLGRHALEELPADSPWRGSVAFSLGTAYYLSGGFAAAAPVFEEAIALSQGGGEYFIQSAAASFLGEILVFQGQLGRAKEMFERVLGWIDPDLPLKGLVMAHSGLADIHHERNQLEEALRHIELGGRHIQQVGGAWSAFVIYRAMARLRYAQGDLPGALEILQKGYELGRRTRVNLVTRQAAALRARIQLAQGDLGAAEAWAAGSGLAPDDPETGSPGWHEVEYITLACVRQAQGRSAEALALLDRLLETAEAQGRTGSAIEILALQSLLFNAQGSEDKAYSPLERALALAEPEGYIRVFVEEGRPMRALLTSLHSRLKGEAHGSEANRSRRLLAYVEKLLAAFSDFHRITREKHKSSGEAISERELEILRLIDAGLTNQEIAERLVIAVSTVKSHINSLYGKLGTHRRTQAIIIARERGLLSN